MLTIGNIVAFIAVISILVTVHEYGHYIVARWCGVNVHRFSVGFGKKLFGWKNSQGTEFCVAAIPLGGYVKMWDSRIDDLSGAELQFAFDHKPVLQRIAVVFAGPLFNLVFAVFALWLMFIIGVPDIKPVVGKTIENSAFSQSELVKGDQIIAINEQLTPNWQSVSLELVSAIGDRQLDVTYQPDGQSYTRTQTIDLAGFDFSQIDSNPLLVFGIEPFQPTITNEVAQIVPDSPASQTLLVGDKIISANGDAYDWRQLSEWIRNNPEQSLSLSVERNEQIIELSLTTGVRKQGSNKVGFLGVAPVVLAYPEEYRFLAQYSVFDAVLQATNNAWRLIELSFSMLKKLIFGDISYKALSGPISIAQGAGQSAGAGLVYFLSFLALISINLGIINLLPLPVLDGGHLVYYFIELLTGRPVPEHIQEIGFKIGMAMIMALMTIALLNDFSRW